jgi:CubicO group peptidase (beta-lactamase class C family)
VRRYVPELPDYGTPIRIRDLLQHTSGLRDYGALDVLTGRETRTTSEFLALLSSQNGLNFTPGTRHEYSHSDFELLGLIVERVAQRPFGEHIERELLQPLGMTGSRVSDARGAHVSERAFGHARSGAAFRVVFNSSEIPGGGNLYASIEDLRHWDRALAEGGSGQRRLVARMLTRPTLPGGDTIPYAYGIRKESYRGLPTVSRGGHSHGVRTEIIRFPDHQLAVATLCNGDHLWAGQRAERVADVYLGDVMQPRRPAYRPPPAVPATEAGLQRYTGVSGSPGSSTFPGS